MSERTTLTRARIVEAATELVETDGHESLSVRKLGAVLGVTAPALYDHVGSKSELLRAVAEVGYERIGEYFAAVSGERAIDRCRRRARAYVDFAQAQPELFRVMFLYRPAAVAIEVDNELPAASAVFESGLADLAEAIADGDLRDDGPVKLSLTIWAAVHGVASISLMAPPLGASVADDVIDAVFTGLRPWGS